MHTRLMQAIRAVRNRWRLRVALRGVAIVVSVGLVLALASLYGMDRMRFTPAAVAILRTGLYLALVALAWRYLIRPLRRAVDEGRVALYLEEHEPALSGQVAGAVEFGGAERAGTSPALVQRLVSRALEQLEAPGGIAAIERPAITRSAMVIGGAALVTAMLAIVQPAFVARGAPFLLPLGAAGTAPYWIDAEPGDTVLARGADLTITAELRNFAAERVELAVRRGAGGEWERWDMPTDEAAGRRALVLFALDSSTTWFVEASGVRTPARTIDVRDLPYVRSLSLEIRPPAYAGQAPVRQDQGDVAALPGSRVVVTVTPTLSPRSGALVFDGGDTVALAPDPSGTLVAAFVVQRADGYRVHLAGADGRLLPASSPYLVTLLEDLPPLVTIPRPGRDVNATSIEELFIEARAEDDYGVRGLELVYSVNGGPERTARLHQGAPRREVTAGHTLFLEEFSLAPGDVVSYYGRAGDARPGARPSSSDIYFVTIRPFDRSFREAQQGGQPQQGQADDDVGQLSQRQREIVAATFNLVRDSTRYGADEFRQHTATLALAQGRLREEVATLAGRLVSRGVASQDSSLRQIADILPRAVSEMQSAETSLGRRDAAGALPPEQRALQHLQRAETIFRRDQQVARGQGGGGGGGGPQTDPELSELFELDLDRMRNQYEQVQRGQREQAGRELDETLERLRELARRQQQEMERREAAARQGGVAGPAGNAQRQLADEAAEMARRLERLSRDQNQPELADAARRLQEAADAMRRAAADRSGAQAASALDRLRDARRQLEQNRSAGLQRDVRALADRARRLAQQQQDVQNDVGRLGADGEAARAERVRRLLERKEQMAGEVAGIAADLDRLGREGRADQPEAARQLREAAAGVRETRLEDKIRFSRGVVQGRDTEYARNFEEIIGADIGRLERQIQAAAGAIGEGREQRLARSLDRAGDLANAVESMGRRAGERADSMAVGGDARARPGEPGDIQGRQAQAGRPGAAQGRPGSPQGARNGGGEPTADAGGPPRGGTAAGDTRQMRSELARRRAELDSLRGRLSREGVDVEQLDAIGRAMGRMDRALAAGDFAAAEDLGRQIAEGLKEFEFDMRRQLAGRDPRRPQLPGSEDVSPEYRRMVEEYYRSLGGRPH